MEHLVNEVGFPGLGLKFTLNRIAMIFESATKQLHFYPPFLRNGSWSGGAFPEGVRVYWYGIIIAIAVLTGALCAILEGKRNGIKSDRMADLICLEVLFGIIGARLYFVLFNLAEFTSFWDVFRINEGGLAIYGAVIGGMFAVWLYSRLTKADIRLLADICVGGLIIAQAIGRWGNFLNVEAYGVPVKILWPWRMTVPATDYLTGLPSTVVVHPTFLYESLWNLIGFSLILWYRKRKKFNGEVFLIYVAWYGLGRAFIEGLRMDSLPYRATWRVSQIVAIVSCAATVALIVYARRKFRLVPKKK